MIISKSSLWSSKIPLPISAFADAESCTELKVTFSTEEKLQKTRKITLHNIFLGGECRKKQKRKKVPGIIDDARREREGNFLRQKRKEKADPGYKSN